MTRAGSSGSPSRCAGASKGSGSAFRGDAEDSSSSWRDHGWAVLGALAAIHVVVPTAPWMYALVSGAEAATTVWWVLLAVPATTMLFPVSGTFMAAFVREDAPLVDHDPRTVRFASVACIAITVVLLLVLALALLLGSGLRLAATLALIVSFTSFLAVWAAGLANDELYETGLLR